MNVAGRDVRLSPGMVAVVKVKIRTRKLTEFILSPPVGMSGEAGREMMAGHRLVNLVRTVAFSSIALAIVATCNLVCGNATSQDLTSDDLPMPVAEILRQPDISPLLKKLTGAQREDFYHLLAIIPNALWTPEQSKEVPQTKKRNGSIELLILTGDEAVGDQEIPLDNEITTISGFIERNGGPTTASSNSIIDSNYWIVFDRPFPFQSAKLEQLISSKYFGGNDETVSTWLKSQENEDCINYLTVDASNTIKQGITLINGRAPLSAKLGCVRRSYYAQVGIYYSPSQIPNNSFVESSPSNLAGLGPTNAKLIEVLYLPDIPSGLPGSSALRCLIVTALESVLR